MTKIIYLFISTEGYYIYIHYMHAEANCVINLGVINVLVFYDIVKLSNWLITVFFVFKART